MLLKRRIIFSILFIAVFGLAQAAWCKVKIATGEYPPFTTEALEDKGFFSAIVKAAFNEVGEEVEFSFLPWKRCEHLVKKGDYFAAIPYAKSEKREKEFDFSDEAYMSIELIYYYEPKNDLSSFNYSEYSDLKSFNIAGIHGYYYVDPMKKLGLKMDSTPNELMAFKKLIAGRVDIILMDQITGMSIIKKNFPNEGQNIKTVKNPSNSSNSFLMISRKYPKAKELTDKFNQGLKKIQENGIYDDILKRHNLL